MANKQSKLSLGLDLRSFNQAIKEAKKSLKDLEGSINGATESGRQTFNRGFGGFGGGGGGGRGPGVPRVPGSSAANAMAGVLSSPLGGMGSILGLGAVAAGIAAAFSRQLEQSRVGLALRSLSGNAIVRGYGSQGFNLQERYERGLQIAGAAGRDLTDESITNFVDSSERLQRAFGISGEQYAGAMGAARKAGVSDQDKFISGVIGDAVADKLSGSAVGEYLAQMTGYMESMAKGVDIDEGSLRGMAAALGSMDFFKKDPSRIFDALRGIEGALKSNDPYKQYLSYRAIQGAAGGMLSPAGVQMRRDMPLFGNALDDKTRKDVEKFLPGVARVYGVSGSSIVERDINQVFKQYFGTGKDKQTEEQDQQTTLAMADALGMTVGQLIPILTKQLELTRSGGNIDNFRLTKKMRTDLAESRKTPEQRAADVMKSYEGSVVKLDQSINILADAASRFVNEGVVKFGEWVQALISGDKSATDIFNPNKPDNIVKRIWDEIPWFGKRDDGTNKDWKDIYGEIDPTAKRLREEYTTSLPASGPTSQMTDRSSVYDSPDVLLTTPHQDSKISQKKKLQEETKAAQESIKSSTVTISPEDSKLKALLDNTFALNQLTMAIRGIRFVTASGRP